MNPPGGEGSSNQPPTPTAPIAEPNVGVSSNNPLAPLENAVATAANEAAAQTTPVPTSVENDFAKQFGGVTSTEPTSATPMPVESNVADPMGQALAGLETSSVVAVPESKPEGQDNAPVASLDPSINTVSDLLEKGPQAVENPNTTGEVVTSVEQTSAEKWQKISDDVRAFLDEVTRDKVAA